LNGIGCGEGLLVLGHYYPPCPQPELIIGTQKHADHDFLIVLLQDQIGGLQALHHGHWVDVPPTPGALVVNIGDLLQARSTNPLRQFCVLNYHLVCFCINALVPPINTD